MVAKGQQREIQDCQLSSRAPELRSEKKVLVEVFLSYHLPAFQLEEKHINILSCRLNKGVGLLQGS